RHEDGGERAPPGKQSREGGGGCARREELPVSSDHVPRIEAGVGRNRCEQARPFLALDRNRTHALRAIPGADLVERPFAGAAVVYTHSHWDHVFGGIEVDAPIVAQASTADRLVALAAMDWSDEGLDLRVAAGAASPEHVANVREELPAPRIVEVAPADVIFHDGLSIELGGATVSVRHLGGDHSAESSVMYVEPDQLLFLGDCTYPSP